MKTLHCPCCGSPARVASVEPMRVANDADAFTKEVSAEEVVVELECLSCSDLIGCSVHMPLSQIHLYGTPPIGTNIYAPLSRYLREC